MLHSSSTWCKLNVCQQFFIIFNVMNRLYHNFNNLSCKGQSIMQKLWLRSWFLHKNIVFLFSYSSDMSIGETEFWRHSPLHPLLTLFSLFSILIKKACLFFSNTNVSWSSDLSTAENCASLNLQSRRQTNLAEYATIGPFGSRNSQSLPPSVLLHSRTAPLHRAKIGILCSSCEIHIWCKCTLTLNQFWTQFTS